MPLVRSFAAATGLDHRARLYELTKALTSAREMTARSRIHNRECINARATEGNIQLVTQLLLKHIIDSHSHQSGILSMKFLM